MRWSIFIEAHLQLSSDQKIGRGQISAVLGKGWRRKLRGHIYIGTNSFIPCSELSWKLPRYIASSPHLGILLHICFIFSMYAFLIISLHCVRERHAISHCDNIVYLLLGYSRLALRSTQDCKQKRYLIMHHPAQPSIPKVVIKQHPCRRGSIYGVAQKPGFEEGITSCIEAVYSPSSVSESYIRTDIHIKISPLIASRLPNIRTRTHQW
jgi:hypothetical protein